MSKKFKSQASSSRAASGAFGAGAFGGFSQASSDNGDVPSSLSYIFEPPDLSLISQPQVVVAFKGLLKKDSTTKLKALEDLLDFVYGADVEEGQLENGFLEAWVKLYPRVSIDVSQRVRQLAHTLQGYIVSRTGKRIARYVPRVIGAWLAGLYDNDKLSVKAAQESIIRAFPTEEKRKNIWKIYQSSILEFVVDAIVQQTPLTLSDERTVRPDEADAKHARVVATALQMLTRLLAKGRSENLTKDAHLLQTLFDSRSLWQLTHHEDPFVRRSVYELCQMAASMTGDYLDWRTISVQVVSKSMSIDHHGSAMEFSNLLLNLTMSRPELWTADYSGKSSALKRLLQYIKKGSQGASSLYWQNLQSLLQSIPLEVLAENQDTGLGARPASAIMESFLEGISHREEPRSSLPAAWASYISTALWVSQKIVDADSRVEFIQSYIFPVLQSYVTSPPEKSKWTIQHQGATLLCAECFVSLAGLLEEKIISEFWTKLSESLSDVVKLSEPEQSQNFHASQDAVCRHSKRFFDLESEILDKAGRLEDLSFIRGVFHKTTLDLFDTSLQVLKCRNGKPYGAACVIEGAVTKVPQFVTGTDAFSSFLVEDLPNLVSSPSSGYLVSIILACREQIRFSFAFRSFIRSLQTALPKSNTLSGLQPLFSSITVDDLNQYPELELMAFEILDQAIQGDKQAWLNIATFLANPSSHHGLSDRLLSRILGGLSTDETALETLRGLSNISNMASLMAFVAGVEGSKLVSRLLFFSDSSDDEIAQLANSLQEKITTGKHGSKPTIEVIQSSFESTSGDNLSVDSLVAIAQDILETSRGQAGMDISKLMPSERQWAAALEPFLQTPPPPSLSIMSPLGGAVFMVERPKEKNKAISLPQDSSQLPLASRLILYVIKMLTSGTADVADPQLRSTLFLYLPLAVQLIEDDMSMEGSTGILPLDAFNARGDFVELVSRSRHYINQWIYSSKTGLSSDDDAPTDALNFWQNQLEHVQGNNPKTFRLAEVYTKVMSERDSLGKVGFAESSFELAQKLNVPSNPFVMVAVITAFRTSLGNTPVITTLCNQMVAQATGLDEFGEVEGLRKLVILNAIMQGESNFAAKIPTQRLVFLVKHLIKCLQSEDMSLTLMTEIFKVLVAVLPQIKEIYGSHWSDVFAVLKTLWQSKKESDEYLPVLHSSLRLFSCLRGLALSECNDDLEDAWDAVKKEHAEILIELLSEFDPSFYPDTPWNITIDLLDRLIKQVNIDHVEDVSGLFATLSVHSRGVQRAVYNVLHRIVPKFQEKLSLNVALSDAVANLPDELLSLLLDPPSANSLSQYTSQDDFYMGLRCYLLSWKTVFDHFAFASLPVQERYSTNIKETDCLNPLLNFMFDFLQSSQGKLVDVSKFDIRFFELDEADSPDKETEWLLTHVYYLCLRYLPNQTKAWWVDSKNRIKGPVEAWTQKYISPLVIEDSLRSVNEWFNGQDWTNEEQALQIKISYKAAEVVASIEVDEDSPPTSISISLPPTYPLQQAIVTGGNRVAVDERKWKSWLMSIQGVIMFSNGNLIDGLLAFRKNVQGALKGHGECAICYSVISSNMQTPNKRCATCKNTFHSECLYRWFKSSNSSSCPLCRNNFLYS